MPRLYNKSRLEKGSLSNLLLGFAIVSAINVIVFLILNSVSTVHFYVNDDFFISQMLSGSAGDYYHYFPYPNVILGYIISAFYQLTAAVNWYGIMLFVSLLASCGVIGAMIIDRLGLKTGLFLYLITETAFFSLTITMFQFTLVAYALLAAGICCALYAFFAENKKTRRFMYILSFIGILFSVLLRKDLLYPAIAYCGLCGLFILISYKKKALPYILVAVITLAGIGCSVLAEKAYNHSSAIMEEYSRCHALRIELNDRAGLVYEAHAPAYEAIDWTTNDVMLIEDRIYPDDELFSMDNIQFIVSSRENIAYNTDMKDVMYTLATIFKSPEYTYIFILMFAAAAFAVISGNAKRRVLAALITALPVGLNIVIIMMWRPTFRAIYPNYLLSAIILLFLIDYSRLFSMFKPRKGVKKALFAAFIAGSCALFAVTFGFQVQMQGCSAAENKERNVQIRADIEEIAKDDEHAYIFTPTSPYVYLNECYGIFDTFEKDYFSNMQLFGGWNTRSPEYYDFLEKYGLSSLPQDLVNKENIYFVAGDNLDNFTVFYIEHYGMYVKYEQVGSCGEYGVYKVLTYTEDELARYGIK